MSRIGKMPVEIPGGVTVTIKKGEVKITGPKGELNRNFGEDMSIVQEGTRLVVSRPSDSREHRSRHGLTRSLLSNMVKGVTNGFEKTLEIVGVGYRAEKSGNNLIIRVGYSHPVEVEPLHGVTLAVEGNNKIIVSGIDKESVGQIAAEIRAIRPPDAYKGKGIRYAGEKITLKAGKTVGKAE